MRRKIINVEIRECRLTTGRYKVWWMRFDGWNPKVFITYDLEGLLDEKQFAQYRRGKGSFRIPHELFVNHSWDGIPMFG